jgi:PAS domain S-box-containing protein
LDLAVEAPVEPTAQLLASAENDPRRVVYRIYALIAGISVAAICVTAYVNFVLSDGYVQSAAISERWTLRAALADELRRDGVRIARPVNEVYYESRPAAIEQIHFELFASNFRRDVEAARVKIVGDERGAVAIRLANEINQIESGADAERMVIARAMTLLTAGQRDEALRLAPEVERSAARLSKEVDDLVILLRGFHQAAVSKQHRQASLVQGFEYLVIFVLIALIAASSLYARRLAEEMSTSLQRKALLGQLQARDSELRRASSTMHMVLNSAADAIFGSDDTGRVIFVNEAGARMLGFTIEEVVGRSLHDLFHRNNVDGASIAAETCPMCSAANSGATLPNDEDVIWRKDGTCVPVESVASPLRDENGAVTGAVLSFRDVSARRAMEKMKDEFVSVVSHELRTPLTAIRGALGLVASGLAGELPEKAQRMLTIASSNTERLVRLINDILDSERIDSVESAVNQVRCNVRALVGQALDFMRPLADKAQIQLEGSLCDADIRADPDRIVQMITNLVGNAIKFSPPQTTVSISATVDGDDVAFEIADHGRGIPADKLTAIFERFQQVDSSDSRDKGGTGLGLSICRSIARQHGGEISVTSEVGRGSQFRFTVPRLAPDITMLPLSSTVVFPRSSEPLVG